MRRTPDVTPMLMVCVALSFGGGCGADGSYVLDEPSGAPPTQAGPVPLDPAGFSAAAEYSASAGGAAVLVMQSGEIVFEEYQNGADELTATHIHSATKGFAATTLAAAIEDGLISGYDEVVAETITEWQDQQLHPGKSAITIGHLAALSSGLSQDVDQIQGLDALAPDIYDYVANNLRLNWEPGSRFQYGPSHYYAFGVLLERKIEEAGLDMNAVEYLEERVLRRIGVAYESWVHDPAGNPHIPNGCTLTPRNWIRFGQLIVQEGRWGDEQILAGDLVRDLSQADGPNPGHGKFLWLNGPGGYGVVDSQVHPDGSEGGWIYHDGFPEIIGALGAGKNRMYLIPSLEAVVVRQTLLDRNTFVDHEFLSALLAP